MIKMCDRWLIGSVGDSRSQREFEVVGSNPARNPISILASKKWVFSKKNFFWSVSYIERNIFHLFLENRFFRPKNSKIYLFFWVLGRKNQFFKNRLKMFLSMWEMTKKFFSKKTYFFDAKIRFRFRAGFEPTTSSFLCDLESATLPMSNRAHILIIACATFFAFWSAVLEP